VVRIDRERPADWSDEEVLRRWTKLFTCPLLVQRYLSNTREGISETEQSRVGEWVDVYRERLYDRSWLMRVLNETIARMANAEDGCPGRFLGRFWERRFKSQALLDEQDVLMAMSYVDLHLIWASITETPEQSSHTSVKQRVEDVSASSVLQTTETCKPIFELN
jgi:hypothetical protein